MRHIRLFFAIAIAKMTRFAGKILKRGSSLPGLLALRMYPGIMHDLQIDCPVIAITGANGKSSTTKLIADILTANGYRVAANLEGSNMRPGILTGILDKTKLSGKVNADFVLMEVDEFSSPKIYSAIKPDYLLVTNVLRDHVERQSDASNVIAKIEQELDERTTLFLNADDPLVNSILYNEPNKRLYYGINDEKYGHDAPSTPLAAKFCLQCGAKLDYSVYYFEHMGKYTCPNCDFHRHEPDYAIEYLDLETGQMVMNNEVYHVNYDAFYMFYNILAAVSVCRELGLTYEQVQSVTDTFVFGNARLQEFYLYERKGVMNFLKNATSLSATIDLMKLDKEEKSILFVMDNTYDRRYLITQWYWDSKVEELVADPNIDKIVCTWYRAYDMAIRLKAAGFPADKIIVERDLEKAVSIFREDTRGNAYVGYDTDSYSIGKVVEALAKYPENTHLRK